MEQIFTKYKTIEPSQEFKARSRLLILSAPQNPARGFSLQELIPQVFQSGLAFGLSAVMIFMLVTGATLLNQKLAPTVLSALDPESLNKEVENMDIQIQIAQVKYYENSAQKVEVALNATSGEIGNYNAQLQELFNDYSL